MLIKFLYKAATIKDFSNVMRSYLLTSDRVITNFSTSARLS